MLIAPKISNCVGEQIAHSTIEEFKTMKSSVSDEQPTEGESTTQENEAEATESVSNGSAENKEYTVYSESKPDIARLRLDSIEYNRNLIKNQSQFLVNEKSYQKPAFDLSSYGITNGVYGYISAPSIGMELPIYLGSNDENMALGAAHMTYTSLPIGGESTNCVLSGHSGYIGRIFFDYIPNMNIGDEITVENYWDTLTYKVIDKQIHKKDESADCYITEGRDLLTLITCISNGHGGFDRFYLICERKST